jgi:rubrerythrin
LDRVQGLRERYRRERDQARSALAEEEEAARGLQAEVWELREQLRDERRQHGCCPECGTPLEGTESLPEPCQVCLRVQGYLLADRAGEPGDLPAA